MMVFQPLGLDSHERLCSLGAIVVAPGASFYRFWIELEGPHRPGESSVILMSPHVFESPSEAFEAAEGWIESARRVRFMLERGWFGIGYDPVYARSVS
jgi:hypothetical protein